MASYPNQSAGTCSGRCTANGMLVGKALAAAGGDVGDVPPKLPASRPAAWK